MACISIYLGLLPQALCSFSAYRTCTNFVGFILKHFIQKSNWILGIDVVPCYTPLLVLVVSVITCDFLCRLLYHFSNRDSFILPFAFICMSFISFYCSMALTMISSSMLNRWWEDILDLVLVKLENYSTLQWVFC